MSEITKELIITSNKQEVQIALLEDKKLVEIHREKSSAQFSVGDIYLGKVRRLNAGLNAAFVDIGSEKDAFLHFLDLGAKALTINNFVAQAREKKANNIANFKSEPLVDKVGKITDVLTSGQPILVQVAKEPISTKGPRITTEISFAGRYIVLIPFSDKISVSQKIKASAERTRLKKIIQGIRPKNFGVIIRTIAKNKSVDDLAADLQQLMDKWNATVKKLATAKIPERVMEELDKTSVLVRDLVNESFNAIYIDEPNLYADVKKYIHSFTTKKNDIVKFYKDDRPIFEHFNVSKQIKSAFGRVVTLKNGIYLIIEQTEAMHVIDVNSGNRMKKESQEENALEVNLEAATEIARQMRLRDLGGLVVVDFIDMDVAQNRKILHAKLKECMANDRAKHAVLPPSKFGLIEITRQRVRQATTIAIDEQCPTCKGSGKIKPSILIEEEIENTIEFLLTKQSEKKIVLAVHPFLYAYLTKGLISRQLRWFFKYKQWIKIESKQDYQFLEYKFFNSKRGEIVLWNTNSKP